MTLLYLPDPDPARRAAVAAALDAAGHAVTADPAGPFALLACPAGTPASDAFARGPVLVYPADAAPAAVVEAIAARLAWRHGVEADLARSDQRFRAFMEHSPAIAFIKDRDGRYLFANRRWEEQFAEPRRDWLGKTDFDFWPADTARQFRASDTAALAADRVLEKAEVGPDRAGGVRHWLTFKFRLADAAGGHLVGGFALEVTEKARLEADLRQAQKMEAIGRMAGGIAHDFNNILTIIGGYTDLLLTALPAGDPSREAVAEIARAGERAAELIRRMLVFGRGPSPQPLTVGLNAVVGGMEKMIRRAVGDGVEVEFRLAAADGPVRADPGQLEQVLLNLAVNARDAMPGGGRLTIATDRADGSAVLTVSDTGVGMGADVKAHLFEPFFTTKDVGKGTGLGLATVYGVVTRAGGTVLVDSEPGRGASFRILLPLAGG